MAREKKENPEKKPNLHAKHRQRVKTKYKENGLTPFSDHEVLELLLFYALPQGDTNPTAHELINAFGSLAGVMDAEIKDLVQVPGVGDHTALLLKLIPDISSRYLASRIREDFLLRETRDLWELFSPHFFGARTEMSWVACFDAKLKLLGLRKLGDGGPTVTEIGVRQVVAAALDCSAAAIVLAHNHPSGVATPSDADVSTTLYLRRLLRSMDVDLYDHVILVDDDMVSMRDSGYFI